MAVLCLSSSSVSGVQQATSRRVRNRSRPIFVAQHAARQSDQFQAATRRTVLSLGLLASSTLLVAAPSLAFLGLGEDGDSGAKDYESETASILTSVREVTSMPRDSDKLEEKVKEVRKDINKWVAKYRREPKFAGRPSFGNTYSVLNALAGHFNSFGAAAPIPKKRLERIMKELTDAELFLSRGR